MSQKWREEVVEKNATDIENLAELINVHLLELHKPDREEVSMEFKQARERTTFACRSVKYALEMLKEFSGAKMETCDDRTLAHCFLSNLQFHVETGYEHYNNARIHLNRAIADAKVTPPSRKDD